MEDYRIFFRFSVRNGNCMVFPFDAATGAELANAAHAPDGFCHDLARSRYLDIQVRRSVMVDSAGGACRTAQNPDCRCGAPDLALFGAPTQVHGTANTWTFQRQEFWKSLAALLGAA
jgi:hypothetical protein